MYKLSNKLYTLNQNSTPLIN